MGAHHWTGSHERRYEQIITSMASLFGMASYVSSTLKSMKESKPRTVGTYSLYFIIQYSSKCIFIASLFISNEHSTH